MIGVFAGFGAKSDSQNVASKQQSVTSTYEKLLAAAEVTEPLRIYKD